MRLDMLPVSVAKDLCDRLVGDSEPPRQRRNCPSLLSQAANLVHLVRRQFRGPVALSHWAIRSSLGQAVKRIVPLGSCEEVIRAKAAGIVALMQNVLSFWYRSILQTKRKPVGGFEFAVMPNSPIPCSLCRSWPLYAGIARGSLLKHVEKQAVAGKLVAHRCALLWRWCMAFAVFTHRGGFFYFNAAGVAQ